MTDRLQIMRSSVAGRRPATGTFRPGEIFVNFADRAFGYIDASGTPVDVGNASAVVTNPKAGALQQINASAGSAAALALDGNGNEALRAVDGDIRLQGAGSDIVIDHGGARLGARDPEGAAEADLADRLLRVMTGPTAGPAGVKGAAIALNEGAGGTAQYTGSAAAMEMGYGSAVGQIKFNLYGTQTAGVKHTITATGAMDWTTATDLPSANSLVTRGRADARYLELTGGVLTGALEVQSNITLDNPAVNPTGRAQLSQSANSSFYVVGSSTAGTYRWGNALRYDMAAEDWFIGGDTSYGATTTKVATIADTTASSAEFKEDFAPLVVPEAFWELQSSAFTYRADSPAWRGDRTCGLLAEDVAAAGFEEAVVRDMKGTVTGLRPLALIGALFEEVKALRKECTP